MTLKEGYNNFLNNHFTGLTLGMPIFYKWQIGLRFDLQTNEVDEGYFKNVINRASVLFESAFEPNDNLYIVILEYKFKKRRIHVNNYIYRHIKDIDHKSISYSKISNYRENIYNKACLKVNASQVDYRNILKSIAYTNFPLGEPWTRKEIYFINIEKKLIFNMYDDRGLDIIAESKEILQPLYVKHKEWILDYDRNKIDALFI